MRTHSLKSGAGCLGLLFWLLGTSIAGAAVPEPIAKWTFEGDARDSVGSLHGALLGDATIADGRLVVHGNGHMRTAPLTADLAAKTLVARVNVAPLDQGGGGVLSVQSVGGLIFDAIVYGERRPGEWIAGSDEFRRTKDLPGAFPEEAGAGFVQMAITYDVDGTIAVYRNGLPYGQVYRPAMGLQTFPANSSEVLLGMRHGSSDRTGGNYFLRGEIDEAALYDRALTAAEVAELAGITLTPETNLLVNGSFETGTPAPWVVTWQTVFGTNPPTTIPIVITNYAAQGGWSFRPYPNSGPGGSRLAQTVPTEPGKEYVLSFAHALTWETAGRFAVLINGEEQDAAVLDPSLPLAHQGLERATWAYGTRTFTATAAATEVAFHFPRELGGYVLLDDIEVRPVAESVSAMTVEFASKALTVEEGAAASILVRRTGRLDQRAFATVELRSGTATVRGLAADADVALGYGTDSGRLGLTFQPGQAEVAVTVHGRADAEAEAPETATLHLLATGNASVVDGPATVTVITPPTRISVTANAWEQAGRGEIVLQVLSGSGGRVRVETTAEGTAKPGEDFIAVDREVSVSAALPPVYVPITVLRDGRIEGEETIGIRVTPLTDGLEVTTPVHLIPLQDEPARVYPVVDSSQLPESGQVSESVSVLRFNLIREGKLDSPEVFQVRYRVEGREDPDNGIAMARSGVDYLPTEGVVEFGPGVAQATVEVPLLNDTEADGPRGLVLQLLGSPQFPNFHHLAYATGWAILADDERAALVQQADFSPFLLGGSASLSRGPDGRTRLVQATRAFELQPSGLPDLNFGGGTGQLSDPTGELTEWDGTSSRLVEPRRLADGRYLFLLPDRIVRWTAQGKPDPSFGNGSGSITLPEAFLRLVHLAADGTLTLVTGNIWDPERLPDRRSLRRFLPDGTPDPNFAVVDFPELPNRFAEERTASGHFWVLTVPQSEIGELELRRLLPDGRPDPSFAPRVGVTRSFGLDALDRAYFAVDASWTSTLGGGAPVALVRFLPDGRLDEGYRPARPDVAWIQGEVSPDGTLLGSTDGLEFLELNPAGELVWQWQYPEAGATDPAANREPDGRIRISAAVRRLECESGGIFGQTFCSSYWKNVAYRISKDGRSEPLYSSELWGSASDFIDAAGTRWVQRSWMETPAAYERSLPVAAGSKVGVGRLTHVVLHGQPIRVPIQRAGSTAGAATLRGRAFPWRNGNWEAESAVPFEAPLPPGAAETDLELVLPASADGLPLTEWLVRIESASGTELSPLNESRLWVFAPAPEGGGVRLVSSAGPDTPHVLWVVGPEGNLQTGFDLNRAAWDPILGGDPGSFPLAPNARVVGWDTASDPGPRFFRVVR